VNAAVIFVGRTFTEPFTASDHAVFLGCSFTAQVKVVGGASFVGCTFEIAPSPAHRSRFHIPLLPHPLSWWARLILETPGE
jgi:hypothetical protein